MDNKNLRFEDLMEEYFEGSICEDHARELAGLIESDPSCREEYSKLAKLHAVSMFPYFKKKQQGNYRDLTARLGFRKKPATLHPRLRIWRNVAAAVVLVAASAGITRLLTADGPASAKLAFTAEAPAGSKSKINLPDGSVVWLNENSKLSLSPTFGKKDRTMQLDGEGYFEVAKDKKLAFAVHVGGIRVKALGTKFNIQGYPGQADVVTTLLEGKVEVTDDMSGDSKVMDAGHMLTFDKSSREMEIAARKNSLLSIIWKNGVWEMNSVPLHELCKELELIYGVHIEILNQEHLGARFTGQLYADEPIDHFLKLIRRTINIRYKQTGDTITIE